MNTDGALHAIETAQWGAWGKVRAIVHDSSPLSLRRVFIEWDSELSAAANHLAAARALCSLRGWSEELVGGRLNMHGTHMCFVRIPAPSARHPI